MSYLSRASVCLALVLFAASRASAAPCDVEYEVQPGDSLRDIAAVAYSATGLQSVGYQLIYSRNAALIDDIAAPPVGETIVIPCQPGELGLSPDGVALAFRMLDAADFEAVAEAAASADEAGVADPAPGETGETGGAGDLTILAAGGEAPLADESLPEGGLAPALTIRALERAGRDVSGAVTVFDSDRDALLDALEEGDDATIGAPWRRPDCETGAGLSARDARLCADFLFSAPLFESISSVFAAPGALPDQAAGFAALEGAWICRAEGRPLDDLEAMGVTADTAEILRAPTLGDCFARLMAGEADYVSADVFEAEAAITGGGFTVEEANWLTIVSTIHAVAAKSAPGAEALIAGIDGGLAALRADGEWFRVVAPYLALR